MERFIFETTQGQVLDAMDEAALMDYARIRSNALRPCLVVGALTFCFCGYFSLKQDYQTAFYTLLVGFLLSAFFWLPMRNTKKFRAGLQTSRDQRQNLTNTVRAKPMRFVLEEDRCRMLDGKGAEVRTWEGVQMTETRESGRLFWLPLEDTAVLLPKSSLTEGTEEGVRRWLRRHSKKYRRCNVTESLRRKMEQ